VSKAKRLGIVILSVGGALGFVLGGTAALLFAAVCLVVGLVTLVVSEARGTRKTQGTGPHSKSQEKAQILVLLKEIHARPQRNGKFQEIGDPDESGLEFEVFINCWLLNETDLPLHVVEPIQLMLKASDGSARYGERINSDLENWRLGSLIKDEWNADKVRAAQEQISELNTNEPLECGVPRQGWLHYRFRDITPSDFRGGVIELLIKDSLSQTHVGRASGPRHMPGRIWPHIAKRMPSVATGIARSSLEHAALQVSGQQGESANAETYYWVVVCKNRKFHDQENIYSGHKIPLVETDEFTPPPKIDAFTVRCDECGAEQTYHPADLMRFQMPIAADFKSHPLFQ
jgi:hypothetical protein